MDNRAESRQVQSIDYSLSDFTNDEIREHQQRMSNSALQEAKESRLRMKRAQNFRRIAGFPA